MDTKPTVTLLRKSTHWKDQMAGWHLWRVVYTDGCKDKFSGTREDVQRLANERNAHSEHEDHEA